ncbi:MAG: hypothetical protein NT062_04385 [Proteobacteria bacterium]|nr:hypothetical protein [Pseudomonadota bacterium]
MRSRIQPSDARRIELESRLADLFRRNAQTLDRLELLACDPASTFAPLDPIDLREAQELEAICAELDRLRVVDA